MGGFLTRLHADPVHAVLAVGVLCFPLLALLACGGEKECRATLVYKGHTGPGTGKGKAGALLGACWGYCGEDDPVVDEFYKDWRQRGGETDGSKMSDLTGKSTLKPVFEKCQATCRSDVAAGKGTITYAPSCK